MLISVELGPILLKSSGMLHPLSHRHTSAKTKTNQTVAFLSVFTNSFVLEPVAFHVKA